MKVFVGFDSKVPAGFWITRASILRHTPDAEVIPLVQQLLRMQGFYHRAPDPLASTEFTYTRFLVPYLSHYEGMSLFLDGDMLVRSDLKPLFDSMGEEHAVACVKHDHFPTEITKMNGTVQSLYPRKNWSSLMMFNCEHPKVSDLTLDAVDNWEASELHQFKWLLDDDIGAYDLTWNWLEGYNSIEQCPDPKIVHYTRGIPGIHEGYGGSAFADEYISTAMNGELTS